MDNNQMHIQIKDDKIRFHTDKPANPLDILTVLFTVQLGMMNDLVSKAPEASKEEIRNDLYDKYNYGASNILAKFAPDLELHPNLTTEAILKAENEILEKNFKESKSVKPRETIGFQKPGLKVLQDQTRLKGI
jgi:hypothetical protein